MYTVKIKKFFNNVTKLETFVGFCLFVMRT